MITAYITGHKIYYDGNNWRYCDNNVKIEDEIKKCPSVEDIQQRKVTIHV